MKPAGRGEEICRPICQQPVAAGAPSERRPGPPAFWIYRLQPGKAPALLRLGTERLRSFSENRLLFCHKAAVWGNFVTAAVIRRLFIQKHQTDSAAPHRMEELINITPPDSDLVIVTAETGFPKGLSQDFLCWYEKTNDFLHVCSFPPSDLWIGAGLGGFGVEMLMAGR